MSNLAVIVLQAGQMQYASVEVVDISERGTRKKTRGLTVAFLDRIPLRAPLVRAVGCIRRHRGCRGEYGTSTSGAVHRRRPTDLVADTDDMADLGVEVGTDRVDPRVVGE